MSHDIIKDQIEYYRARAREYDRSVLGSDATEAALPDPFARAADLLRKQGHFARALELACGTGIWTRILAGMADHVSALDAAPEMLDEARSKLPAGNVTFEQADLFTWQPDSRYDLVLSAFFLSHVPPDALDSFLERATRAILPAGRLILIDQHSPSAADSSIAHGDYYADRTLADGRTFTIVKIFYSLDFLRDRLAQLGFHADTQDLGNTFFFLSATRLVTT
jgi:ubiquinone/menaquinone biosynthesis C-methylase UbiE